MPLLRPTIDTMSPTTVPDEVDSYATTPGILHARVVLGKPSTFVLFDGAMISQEETDQGARLASIDGDEFKHGVQFEVVAFGAAPASVTVDGEALPRSPISELAAGVQPAWAFDADAAGGTLHVRAPSGSRGVDVVR